MEPTRVVCVVSNDCKLEGVHLAVKLPTGVRSPMPCLGAADEALFAAWAKMHAAEGGAADCVLLPHAHRCACCTMCNPQAWIIHKYRATCLKLQTAQASSHDPDKYQ